MKVNEPVFEITGLRQYVLTCDSGKGLSYYPFVSRLKPSGLNTDRVMDQLGLFKGDYIGAKLHCYTGITEVK